MVFYLVRCDGFVKIGHAQHFQKRMGQYRTHNPHPVEVVFVYEHVYAFEVESYWQRMFKDKLLHGEWYRLTAEDVELIKTKTADLLKPAVKGIKLE